MYFILMYLEAAVTPRSEGTRIRGVIGIKENIYHSRGGCLTGAVTSARLEEHDQPQCSRGEVAGQ